MHNIHELDQNIYIPNLYWTPINLYNSSLKRLTQVQITPNKLYFNQCGETVSEDYILL